MKRILVACAFLLLLHTVVIAAPATNNAAPATPNPTANAVLAAIQKMGAKFFFLGTHSDMNGWFVVKDGQVQIIYTSADNKAAIIGAMFGEDGQNVTALQVAALMHDNKEVADLISSAQKEQEAIAQAGSAPSAKSPANDGGVPSTPLSPGERLMQDLSAASTVVVGRESTPELVMVMDPHCPHCQATWKVLRDSVMSGKMHIRMVPIGTQDSDNERAAAVLLGVSDPSAVWDAYVEGDKSKLAGTPSTNALAAVRANHVLIDKWSIQNTPYLVYRAKDGKIKVVQGEPAKVAVVLSDMGL